MQYLMLLTIDPAAADGPEAAQRDEWSAYTQALIEAGIMVSGAGLQGVETATTVQVRSGERLLTDGPFADTKEHVAGYELIEATDLDEAIEVAAGHPATTAGAIEIRPFHVWPEA
jgi:hypothetical protein